MAAQGPLAVQVLLPATAQAPIGYPPAEASHGDVSADRELFDRTLKNVHDYFGIADKVPKVGGRELDLHQLYRNVTALGGCAEVISKKQWRVHHDFCDLVGSEMQFIASPFPDDSFHYCQHGLCQDFID